jgi:hypothetical protein
VDRTFGEQPRPWVLAVGGGDWWSEIRQALDSLQDVTIDYVDDLSDVDQSEYDAAVSVLVGGRFPQHVPVLTFSGPSPDWFQVE